MAVRAIGLTGRLRARGAGPANMGPMSTPDPTPAPATGTAGDAGAGSGGRDVDPAEDAGTRAEHAGGVTGVGGDGTAVDDGGAFPGGLTWPRVAAIAAALAFLGFAVGVFAGRDRPPAADSAEVGFLQDMITHHDQALGVATLTIAHGEDPTVRSYAREVIAFQSYEIGLMTQMLRDWGHSRDDRSDEAMAWMDMPVPVEAMPGLLSDGQLAAVGAARGTDIDRLFLELMAEHHRGGLHMAEAAPGLVDDDEVAALAARMERNQAGEIDEYRATAEALGFDLDIAPAGVPAEF